MFASIMPGLRELRVPLAAGALILTSAGTLLLLTGIDMTDSRLWPPLEAAGNWVGAAFVIGALSFVAYLIGLIPAKWNTGTWLRSSKTWRESRIMVRYDLDQRSAEDEVRRRIRDALLQARSRGVSVLDALALFPKLAQEERNRYSDRERLQYVEEAAADWNEEHSKRPSLTAIDHSERWEWLIRKSDYIAAEVLNRTSASEDHLLVAEPELFARFDRMQAEGHFRQAIAAPLGLAIVVISFGIGAEPSWLAGSIGLATAIGACIALTYSGVLQQRESSIMTTRHIGAGLLVPANMQSIVDLKARDEDAR